jgi:hypothetical protein
MVSPKTPKKALPRLVLVGWPLGLAIKGTLFEIDGFSALGASVGLVKLIGEDLFLLAALRAFADKGFQRFKILKAGAVLRCRCHAYPPLSGGRQLLYDLAAIILSDTNGTGHLTAFKAQGGGGHLHFEDLVHGVEDPVQGLAAPANLSTSLQARSGFI